MERRRGPPGRETDAASSTDRRIWYGYGTLGRAEKDPFGMFLQDIIRVFGEISVFALPSLLAVMFVETGTWYDAKATGLVAWILMATVGALIRGGWIRPLATDVRGWVTLSPWLLVLRFVYFNAAFSTATFGGVAVGAAVWGPASLLWAGSVAVLSILLFPRIGEETAARVGTYY